MSKPLPDDFDDNPEWTEEEFAAAKPASELHPPHIAALLVRAPAVWEEVTLDLDREVIDKFRATGPGWEARINEVLRASAPSDIHSDAA